MQIIKDWNKCVEEHLRTIEDFLFETNELHEIYSSSTKNRTDIGFNAFTLTSDFYYRENFHSDIIKSFLNPQGKHNEGIKYLNNFLDLLNKTNNQIEISKEDFKNSKVEREQYFIVEEKKRFVDLLITDEVSKKSIIIENKINNAVDQERQLPDYINALKNENFDVVAVVYLTLDSSKRPDKADWSPQELDEINTILKLIPAFETDKTKINLFDNWIVPSIIDSTNIDSSFLLRQYGNLIKYLNTNAMDTVSLEKFYDSLQENDNLKTAVSIRNMLNDLPEYLSIRIEDKYKNHCYPFGKIGRYKQRDTVFYDFNLDNHNLKLDVWCDVDGYTVHFWEPEDNEFDISAEFKGKIKVLSDFNIHNNEKNNIKKRFEIFEESRLFEFIDTLLSDLINIMKLK